MQQVKPTELVRLFENNQCNIIKKVHVTCVFPKLRSALADRLLTEVCRLLPFSIGCYVSESYALVFQKK
jgi:hypothetical protein